MKNNNIQFYHQTQNEIFSRLTVALEVPTIKDIINTASLHTSPNISMKLGITYVHPNDNYNRKIGRELSLTRLNTIDFILTKIEFDDIGRHIYQFNSMDDEHIIYLRLNPKSNKAHFIEYSNVGI